MPMSNQAKLRRKITRILADSANEAEAVARLAAFANDRFNDGRLWAFQRSLRAADVYQKPWDIRNAIREQAERIPAPTEEPT